MQDRRFWIVVPSRGFARGKTRLASILGAEARRDFNRRSFRHVVAAARRVAPAKHIAVVSRSGDVLGLARRMGAVAVRERQAGLNESAHQGADHAQRHAALGVLVLHADLPVLDASELRSMLHALSRHPGAALAPDRGREGTNALGLRTRRNFRFRFGEDSFARHLAEARRRRIRARALELAGAARDVDTPDHYLELRRRA